jgi:hypothetical protein
MHENALGGYEKALEPHRTSTLGEGTNLARRLRWAPLITYSITAAVFRRLDTASPMRHGIAFHQSFICE